MSYENRLLNSNRKQDWLIKLFYGSGSTQFIGLSGQKRIIDGVFYDGIVQDWGTIQEKIGLKDSSHAISDVAITCKNKYGLGTLSEVIGINRTGNSYTNKKVEIYQWLGGDTLSECKLIYEGRLLRTPHGAETCELLIEKRDITDRKLVPSIRTTGDTGNYFPAVYGTYIADGSTSASPDFLSADTRLWPMVIDSYTPDVYRGLAPFNASGSMHVFESTQNKYAKITPEASPLSGAYKGGIANFAPIYQTRTFDYTPLAEVGDTNTYPDAVDAITSTGAKLDNYLADTTEILELKMPNISGTITDKFDLNFEYQYIVAGSPATNVCQIYDATFGSDVLITTLTDNNVIFASISPFDWLTNGFDGTMPDTIILKFVFSNFEFQYDFTIRNLFLEATFGLDVTQEPAAVNSDIEATNVLYSSCPGLKSGPIPIVLPHDIYRDMISRYTSNSYSDSEIIVNGDAWNVSSIDTDRPWNCRWWATAQESLPDALKQLSKEGAFIWITNDDTVKVIYIKPSYSASDVKYILTKRDLVAVESTHTAFSDVVTERVTSYDKIAATEKYREVVTKTNSTVRTRYNIGVDENVIGDQLDFVAETAGADGYQSYYDGVTGDIYLHVNAELAGDGVTKWDLEVGDIVQYTDMPVEPQGETYAGKYFMITSTTRGAQSFKFTSVEVG